MSQTRSLHRRDASDKLVYHYCCHVQRRYPKAREYMGWSRSRSLTKDSTLPELSSRFLRYLGVDAHQKPTLKKLAGISSNNSRIASSNSQSNSTVPFGPGLVSVKSLLPDFQNERRGQIQPASTTPSYALSAHLVGGAREFFGNMSSISIPLSDVGLHTHSTLSPTSPTTFHAPHSWVGNSVSPQYPSCHRPPAPLERQPRPLHCRPPQRVTY